MNDGGGGTREKVKGKKEEEEEKKESVEISLAGIIQMNERYLERMKVYEL
jgi:hypothetical protein